MAREVMVRHVWGAVCGQRSIALANLVYTKQWDTGSCTSRGARMSCPLRLLIAKAKIE